MADSTEASSVVVQISSQPSYEQVQRDIFEYLVKVEAHLSVLRVEAEARILDASKDTHNGWQRAKELVLELAEKAKAAV